MLKAAKKLYIARTSDSSLFKKDSRQDINIKPLSNKAASELELHKAIKFYYKDNICLYFSNMMGRFFPFSFCWKKKNKFQKLYK